MVMGKRGGEVPGSAVAIAHGIKRTKLEQTEPAASVRVRILNQISPNTQTYGDAALRRSSIGFRVSAMHHGCEPAPCYADMERVLIDPSGERVADDDRFFEVDLTLTNSDERAVPAGRIDIMVMLVLRTELGSAGIVPSKGYAGVYAAAQSHSYIFASE